MAIRTPAVRKDLEYALVAPRTGESLEHAFAVGYGDQTRMRSVYLDVFWSQCVALHTLDEFGDWANVRREQVQIRCERIVNRADVK